MKERHTDMRFDAEKLKEISKPRSAEAAEAAARRRRNRKWMRMSQDIALSMRQHLRETGMTQKCLAERLQVSPAYVAKILKGQENLTLETISMLQEALGYALVSVKSPYVRTMTVQGTSLANFRSTSSSGKYCNTLRWKTATAKTSCNVA